eukprot:400279-Pyramimonas_sp.AAC.1
MGRIAPSSLVAGSFEEERAGHSRGGVAAVIPLAASAGATATPRSLVPGRVLRAVIQNGEVEIRRCNARDRGLSSAEVLHAAALINEDRAWASLAPGTRILVVCGDFNFASHDPLQICNL